MESSWAETHHGKTIDLYLLEKLGRFMILYQQFNFLLIFYCGGEKKKQTKKRFLQIAKEKEYKFVSTF